jgi:hypothetical protein
MGRTPVFVASLSVTASRMLIRRTCPFVTGFCGCHNCSSSSIVRLSWDIEGWRLASADFSGFVESYSYLCFLSRGAKRKNKESERASRCVYWSIYICRTTDSLYEEAFRTSFHGFNPFSFVERVNSFPRSKAVFRKRLVTRGPPVT